jgi:KDO2-lipid IV(A) lauroyltransferase
LSAPGLQHRLEYYALRAVIGALSALPFELARRLGATVGGLGYRPLGIRRGVVERQIAAAFPGLPPNEVDRLAKEAYRNLGRTSVESALGSRRGREGVLAMFESEDDLSPLQRAIEAGKGAIIVTGHLGNWELGAGYLAARGVPILAIARRQSNGLFDDYLNRTREALGVHVIPDYEAVRRAARAFNEGKVVAFVADQGVMGVASTFVPFFGRPAKTPRGAAVFAIRLQLPVFFGTAVLQPSGKYHLVLREVEVAQTGQRESDVDATVARFTRALEAEVRRYPEQYFWHHRRWRRQPPGTPIELREP